MITDNDIFPVVVIYKIALRQTAAYEHFLSRLALQEWMVYDNSPCEFVQPLDALPAGVVYVRDEQNGGLSKAYNTAARYASEHGYKRLLLLDQDTLFEPSMYELLCNTDSDVCAPRVVLKGNVPFSPSVWARLRIKGVSLAPDIYPLKDYMLINSGLCVSLKVFEAAGGYNEDVKLDFADFQFMQRLRRHVDWFELLESVAVQDFSNDITDTSALLQRFEKYLDGASHFQADSVCEYLKIRWVVFLHLIALTIRTKSLSFAKKWIRRG